MCTMAGIEPDKSHRLSKALWIQASSVRMSASLLQWVPSQIASLRSHQIVLLCSLMLPPRTAQPLAQWVITDICAVQTGLPKLKIASNHEDSVPLYPNKSLASVDPPHCLSSSEKYEITVDDVSSPKPAEN